MFSSMFKTVGTAKEDPLLIRYVKAVEEVLPTLVHVNRRPELHAVVPNSLPDLQPNPTGAHRQLRRWILICLADFTAAPELVHCSADFGAAGACPACHLRMDR